MCNKTNAVVVSVKIRGYLVDYTDNSRACTVRFRLFEAFLGQIGISKNNQQLASQKIKKVSSVKQSFW